jgi:hypothetical protein
MRFKLGLRYWLLFLALSVAPAWSQQAATTPSAATRANENPEFLATADEVLKDMSEITGWRLKSPLKKSIRTREEIHAYVIEQMNDEKDAKERYASARSAEAFGLIPKGFDADRFLVDLLTEQIAGLYDPKSHEFYIADWIAPDEQRMVMSHELTHALQDQYFHIEAWARAARPNDDAELARDSVLEGSAMAGMLEYTLREKGLKLRDLPDVDLSVFVGDLAETPTLKKAPPFIKDSLLFPYFSGLNFSMSILRTDGWSGFADVFSRPPAGTQQIMHPEMYRADKAAAPIKVDLPEGVPDTSWNKLEENTIGEFGWKEVLKQFLDEERANKVSAAWDNDDYITFEQKSTKRLMLFSRTRFRSEELANRFFSEYSEALKKKHAERTHNSSGELELAFDTPDGGVFLRCLKRECITLEGGDAVLFAQWIKKLDWPAHTATPSKPADAAPTPPGSATVKAQ